jgi:hypothetical protein
MQYITAQADELLRLSKNIGSGWKNVGNGLKFNWSQVSLASAAGPSSLQ